MTLNKRPYITVIGSGEAFDSTFGNSSYLLSGITTGAVLIDCGYQVPERLWKKKLHKNISHIFFTHFHADHSFGIAPLLTRYWEENRTKHLVISGPPGTERFIKKIVQMGYPGIYKKFKFDIIFRELNTNEKNQFKKFTVQCARTRHSVLNLCLRFESDLNTFLPIAFSGDGNITEGAKLLYNNVNLLIHEVYSLKTNIPTHTNLNTLKKELKNLKINRIGITHHARTEWKKIRARSKELFNGDIKIFSISPLRRVKL